MTTPNSILAAKRSRIAALEASLASERAELRGMETMAQALTGQVREMTPADWKRAKDATDDFVRKVAKGRQPGSITNEWRQVLAHLGDQPFTAADLAAYPQLLFGRNVSVAEGRRRLDLFMSHDYVEDVGDNRYRVTPHAMQKFGLKSLIQDGEASAEPIDRDEGASDPLAPDSEPLTND